MIILTSIKCCWFLCTVLCHKSRVGREWCSPKSLSSRGSLDCTKYNFHIFVLHSILCTVFLYRYGLSQGLLLRVFNLRNTQWKNLNNDVRVNLYSVYICIMHYPQYHVYILTVYACLSYRSCSSQKSSEGSALSLILLSLSPNERFCMTRKVHDFFFHCFYTA